MLETLKETVCAANLELVRAGLVLLTWGNASGIDRAAGLVVIKPSGVPYAAMRPADMTVVDLEGNRVEGEYAPSVDTPTHLALYHAFPATGGVVHTHSHYATTWAQALRPIPCFGTTHADLAHGPIPVTDVLTPAEVEHEYERHIGQSIARLFQDRDPMHCPAALAANHGPFTWGHTPAHAVENAIALEEVARMAAGTLALNPAAPPIPTHLLDKHFLRKHGANAYYGQTPRS